jgi:molecular chaperone GrpE
LIVAVTEQRLPTANEAPPEREEGTETGTAPHHDAVERSQPTEVAALESQLRRALADVDNLRRRMDREIARQRANERADVAARWLPVVDNLERALEHAGSDADAVLEGVRAVRDQAVDILAALGFPRFDEVDRPFDPARDEAISAMAADAPPGTVVAVVRPGYGTTETVLRPAGVIVSKGAD